MDKNKCYNTRTLFSNENLMGIFSKLFGRAKNAADATAATAQDAAAGAADMAGSAAGAVADTADMAGDAAGAAVDAMGDAANAVADTVSGNTETEEDKPVA